MREKSALSWKEAREEASFRKGPSDADEEEDGHQLQVNGAHQADTHNNKVKDTWGLGKMHDTWGDGK